MSLTLSPHNPLLLPNPSTLLETPIHTHMDAHHFLISPLSAAPQSLSDTFVPHSSTGKADQHPSCYSGLGSTELFDMSFTLENPKIARVKFPWQPPLSHMTTKSPLPKKETPPAGTVRKLVELTGKGRTLSLTMKCI